MTNYTVIKTTIAYKPNTNTWGIIAVWAVKHLLVGGLYFKINAGYMLLNPTFGSTILFQCPCILARKFAGFTSS